MALPEWQALRREIKKNNSDFTQQQIRVELDKIWYNPDAKAKWMAQYESMKKAAEPAPQTPPVVQPEPAKKAKKKAKVQVVEEDSSSDEEIEKIKKKMKKLKVVQEEPPKKKGMSEKDIIKAYYKIKYEK